MKYITLFDTLEEYRKEKRHLDTPNVSYTQDNAEVHFLPEYDFSKDYLTTEALESGTISFNIWRSMGTDYITSISYSTDNGETWTTTNNTNDKEENLQITVNVNEGDKVLWKGNAQLLGYYDSEDESDYVGSFFSSTARFNVFGNVMSMLYGDDFVGEETLEYDVQFANLFYDYYRESETKVIDASNLSLAATTLSSYCYINMFSGCTSLTTAPELPATTLAIGCYMYMFSGCTSLNSITCLATNISATNCTANWVQNVAANGTFTKDASMSSWTTGDNGIPANWTVQDAE